MSRIGIDIHDYPSFAKLLFLGTFLAWLGGIAQCIEDESIPLTLSHTTLFFVCGGLIYGFKFVRPSLSRHSWVFVICITLLMTNTLTHQILIPSEINLLYLMILSLGIIELSWSFTTPFILYTHALAGLYFTAATITFSSLTPYERALTWLPFILLMIWKLASAFFHQKSYRFQRDIERLHAFKMSMVTVNHEMRNIAQVIFGSITLVKATKNTDHMEPISRATDRLIQVIDQIQDLDQLTESTYLRKEAMVDISSETKKAS